MDGILCEVTLRHRKSDSPGNAVKYHPRAQNGGDRWKLPVFRPGHPEKLALDPLGPEAHGKDSNCDTWNCDTWIAILAKAE
jgi:hypothetical protein